MNTLKITSLEELTPEAIVVIKAYLKDVPASFQELLDAIRLPSNGAWVNETINSDRTVSAILTEYAFTEYGTRVAIKGKIVRKHSNIFYPEEIEQVIYITSEFPNPAMLDQLWLEHTISSVYSMDGNAGWKIAYYPIFEDGKTGEKYEEPRALVEKPIVIKNQKGTDFREVPLRYLTKVS